MLAANQERNRKKEAYRIGIAPGLSPQRRQSSPPPGEPQVRRREAVLAKLQAQLLGGHKLGRQMLISNVLLRRLQRLGLVDAEGLGRHVIAGCRISSRSATHADVTEFAAAALAGQLIVVAQGSEYL